MWRIRRAGTEQYQCRGDGDNNERPPLHAAGLVVARLRIGCRRVPRPVTWTSYDWISRRLRGRPLHRVEVPRCRLRLKRAGNRAGDAAEELLRPGGTRPRRGHRDVRAGGDRSVGDHRQAGSSAFWSPLVDLTATSLWRTARGHPSPRTRSARTRWYPPGSGSLRVAPTSSWVNDCPAVRPRTWRSRDSDGRTSRNGSLRIDDRLRVTSSAPRPRRNVGDPYVGLTSSATSCPWWVSSQSQGRSCCRA